MPQIGPLEILVVSVIALIVFGPERLPAIARQVGRTLNELKRQANSIKADFQEGLEDDDVDDEQWSPPHHPATKATPAPETPTPAAEDDGSATSPPA